MKKIILAIVFILGLLYVLSPGPGSVTDFSPIPDSLKSNEPGDTTQVPNISAYFSNFNRQQITQYYQDQYRSKHLFGFIPPVSLNYPPKAAYTYIRDLQMSTFLEEYVYPLRGSVFVNGYEPYVEDEIKGRGHSYFGDRIHINGDYYWSKATIRFYPAGTIVRLLVYTGIWISSVLLIKQYRKAFAKKIHL